MGKMSVEEDNRMRQAVTNDEDHNTVAKELGRDPRQVHSRMIRLRINPESQIKKTRFTVRRI